MYTFLRLASNYQRTPTASLSWPRFGLPCLLIVRPPVHRLRLLVYATTSVYRNYIYVYIYVHLSSYIYIYTYTYIYMDR